jgi:leader peptidase (prepilin peptidase)/N-methyltransferase
VQDDPEGVAAKAARHDPVSEELTEAARLIPGPPGIAELVGAGVVTAVLFGAAAIRFGPVPALAPYCVFFGGLVALSIADIRVGLVPRKILYPTLGLMVVGLVAASVVNDDWWALARAAIGGTGAFFVFVGIYVLYPRGMGFGDVRLAGVMGVGLGWLGFQQIYAGFLVGFLAGALYGGVKMVVAGSGRKTRFPFGPGLAFGAVIGVLFGGWLATFWLLHST